MNLKQKEKKIFYSFESLKNEESNKIISKGIASISLVISPFCFLMLISISLTTRGRLELSKYENTVASIWWKEAADVPSLGGNKTHSTLTAFRQSSPSSVYLTESPVQTHFGGT